MKTIRKTWFAWVAAAVVALSVTACRTFSPPDTYTVGEETPVPSITAVVGGRDFAGSSTTTQGGSGGDPLSVACTYENISDVGGDLSQYISALTSAYGFHETSAFDPSHPEKGAVLQKPAAAPGHTLTLTITVPQEGSYRISLESSEP